MKRGDKTVKPQLSQCQSDGQAGSCAPSVNRLSHGEIQLSHVLSIRLFTRQRILLLFFMLLYSFYGAFSHKVPWINQLCNYVTCGFTSSVSDQIQRKIMWNSQVGHSEEAFNCFKHQKSLTKDHFFKSQKNPLFRNKNNPSVKRYELT